MNLSERLKKKTCKVESVVVDGDRYLVTGKSKLDRAKLYAAARKKDGLLDVDKLETSMLVACVSGEDGSTATADEWNGAPSHITGPLLTAVMSVCGMDKDDLQRDPKDSGSTEN